MHGPIVLVIKLASNLPVFWQHKITFSGISKKVKVVFGCKKADVIHNYRPLKTVKILNKPKLTKLRSVA